MKHIHFVDTPVGRIGLIGDGDALVQLLLPGECAPGDCAQDMTPVLMEAGRQLRAYFAGEPRAFDVPLAPRGTPFQQSVWRALVAIPYGETRTYAQIARQLDRPKSCRAVGGANHANPIPILIPCHRVIGASGTLTGYRGGLDMKRALLRLEGLV